jgi:hypothetical protein
MSERRSRFWLWVCIIVLSSLLIHDVLVHSYAINDLQRRVGTLEQVNKR